MGARTARGFSLDHPVGTAIGHQGRQHRVAEFVAAADLAIGAEQRQTGEREIADHVEHLVAYAFVAVTQPLGVE